MATAEREGGRLPEGRRAVTLGFVARAALVVILLCALAGLVWLGRDVLFIAFFAVLVASFLSIFVGWLEARGVPRAAAAIGVLLLGVGMAAVAAVLLWPTLREQALELREQLPAALAQVVAWAEGQYRVLSGQFGTPAGPIQDQVQQRVTMEVARLLTGALPLLNSLVGAVGGGLVVLFAGLYLAIEPRLYLDGLVSLVPRRNRPRIRQALEEVGSTLRRWMVGTALSMALIAVLTSAGLWLLDIPAALALGLLAGLLEFIPYFGPILSAVPALMLALVISPAKALWVLLLYVGIQQAEANLVLPLLMKGMVQLPPALTLLVQVLMSVLFGFLGLLLAVPALAAGKVLIQALYVEAVADTG